MGTLTQGSTSGDSGPEFLPLALPWATVRRPAGLRTGEAVSYRFTNVQSADSRERGDSCNFQLLDSRFRGNDDNVAFRIVNRGQGGS